MKRFLRIICSCLLLCTLASRANEAKAQSMVCEISWNVGITYQGLLVTYPDNSGLFVVKYYNPYIQSVVWVNQSVLCSSQYDMYGGCTTIINCYNPVSYPNVAYSADNFIIYPDGSMYAQDDAGTWSTAIAAYVVSPQNWSSKFIEYGLQ